jgi:ABC-type glutathione transport system ATPase component
MTARTPELSSVQIVAAQHQDDVPVIGFESVTKRYHGVTALDQVSFTLPAGLTLGLVGESGSGKTTCVRLALGLERPTAGQVTFGGQPYPRSRRQLRPLRRQFGFVLQDPYDSLDPRRTLRDIVSEPLRVHGMRSRDTDGRDTDRRDTDTRIADMLAAVGLRDAPLGSYPSRYSGGGLQRIAIARALITDPAVLICDEPTSSLDVSVQAQIINLLLEARRGRGLSVLFVSHDLDLIGRVADTLVVMYRGRVVECGPAQLVRSQPRHPYTRSLHDAVPADDPARRRLVAASGSVGRGDDPPNPPRDGRGDDPQAEPARRAPATDSCVFADRCPVVRDRCRTQRPPAVTDADGRTHACFFPLA